MSNAVLEGSNGRAFAVTNRMVLSVAIPMTLAFLTTPLLGVVDTAVVGRLGDPALIGGLAAGAIVFDVVFSTMNFLRSGTTGLVAQANGRGDILEEKAAFWRAMIIACALGVLILILGHPITAAGRWFMDAEIGVAEAMTAYILIRVLSAPLSLGNYVVLGYVLGRGEGLTGLAFQLVLNGSNIVLSIWLGLGLGWGLEGVAWGTVFGEASAFVAGMIFLLFRFRRLPRVSVARIFDMTAMARVLDVSRDIMIRSFSLLAAFALFTRTGAQLGTLVLAANAILLNFFMVAGFFLDGFATAAEQLAGRALGARHEPAFRRTVWLTLIWGFALAGGLAGLFFLFGDHLIALMTTAPDVRAEAGRYLWMAALCAVTGVLAFQMDGVFIGATWSRDMRNMMLLSLAVYVAALWLMVPLLGNHGLWLALHTFLVVRGASLLFVLPLRARTAFSA